MFAFSADLFIASDGSAMRFNVRKCRDAEELTEYIEEGGGSVDRKVGPFTIDLHDVDECPVNKAEAAFHSNFIIKSCIRDQILDLKEFKCPSAIPFSKDFEPNDVLHHKISWVNAQQQFLKPDSSTENSGSLEDASESIEEQPASAITKSTGPRQTAKRPYSPEEDDAILRYIERYSSTNCFLKGNKFWQNMEEDGVVKGRTWQSIKERYLKHLKKVPEQPRPKSAVVRKQVSDRMRTTAATKKKPDCSTDESDLNDSDGLQDVAPERPRPKKNKLFTCLSNKMSEEDCNNNMSPTEKVPNSKKQEICITAAARNTNTESNESSAPTAEVCGKNSSKGPIMIDLTSPSPNKDIHLPLKKTVAAGSPDVENSSSNIVQESVLLSWPSNFRAERSEFAVDSDCCEVYSLSSSITDSEDGEIPWSRMAKDSVVMNVAGSSHSDSDWSSDGLFWRGECDMPSRRPLRSATSATMKPDAQSTQVITPCIQTVEACTETNEPETQSAEPCAQTVQSEMKGTVQVDTSQITFTRAIPKQVGTNAAANKVKINVTSQPLDLSARSTHPNSISHEIVKVEVSHQQNNRKNLKSRDVSVQTY